MVNVLFVLNEEWVQDSGVTFGQD